jgi:hypothetical protein
MPMIYVDKGEDPLKVYKRYRATVWYKRVSRKQWFIFGVGTGLFSLVAPTVWEFVSGYLATMVSGGLLGAFLGGG